MNSMAAIGKRAEARWGVDNPLQRISLCQPANSFVGISPLAPSNEFDGCYWETR
jgi:hypothetical protein